MNAVPVATAVVDEPLQEVSKVASNIRNSTNSIVVGSTSKAAPVNNDHIVVSVRQESVPDVIVDGRVAVVVPSVNDDFECSGSVVVGVANGVHVAVDDELAGVGITSERIFNVMVTSRKLTHEKLFLTQVLCVIQSMMFELIFFEEFRVEYLNSKLINHISYTKCNYSGSR